jgi:hypothetical protein
MRCEIRKNMAARRMPAENEVGWQSLAMFAAVDPWQQPPGVIKAHRQQPTMGSKSGQRPDGASYGKFGEIEAPKFHKSLRLSQF